MAKVKEAFYDDDWNEFRMSCGRLPKPAATERKRREKPQVQGQMSFISENGELRIDDSFEKQRAADKKAAMLAYYDAFHDMLNRYGKFNTAYNLLECIESGKLTDNVRNTLNYHYQGDVETVKRSTGRARHWLKVSQARFAAAAKAVNLFDVDGRYDVAYREKERRDKFRSIIKRERAKVEKDKTTEVYSPQDMEDEYQMWRFKKI